MDLRAATTSRSGLALSTESAVDDTAQPEWHLRLAIGSQVAAEARAAVKVGLAMHLPCDMPSTLSEACCKHMEFLLRGPLVLQGMHDIKLSRLWRVLQAETGFRSSAGVACNKMLAKLISGLHKPNDQTVLPPPHAADFVAPLPVRAIPGKAAA